MEILEWKTTASNIYDKDFSQTIFHKENRPSMFDNLLSTPLWPIDIWNTSAGNKVTTLRSHLDRNSTFLKGVFPIPTCLLSRKNIWGNVFKNGQVHFLKAVFHKIYLVHSWILCLIFSTIFHNNFNMCFVHIFPMNFPVLFCF